MNLTIKEMALVAIYPAMMAVSAQISIPLGSLPAITLQTLFVYLAGLTLGWKLGSISMIIYILMGVVGIPVFTELRAISAFASVSGGFIISFPIAAFFIGLLKDLSFIKNEVLRYTLILGLSTILIYVIGAAYISIWVGVGFFATLISLYIFLVGDIIKIILALFVYMRIKEHITYE